MSKSDWTTQLQLFTSMSDWATRR